MKEYERLTKRTENNGVQFDANGYTHTIYPQNENCLRDIDKLAIRLAELEDAIESGELVDIQKWFYEPARKVDGTIRYSICKYVKGIYDSCDTARQAELKLQELEGKI